MPNIATLTVNLVAETARFTVNLKKSRRDADRFARKVKKSLTAITTVSTLAGGAFITLARQSIKAADQIGKTAKAVGLSAESLQELRFAAQQSGVETRGLDDSVRRFNRRLGEFANSAGGPAAQGIKSLGVEVRDTTGAMRSTESIFNDVVDRMTRIESQAQRAALAAQLFGDDFGPKLTPLLDQGADGIERLRKEARDLGIVMSNQTVASAERAEDTFGRLESIVRGRMIKAFADNAEQIERATEAIISFVIATINEFNKLRQFFGFTTETEELLQRQNRLLEERKKIQESLESGQFSTRLPDDRSSGILGMSASQITRQVDAIRGGAEAAQARLAEVDTALSQITSRLAEISKSRDSLAEIGKRAIEGTNFGTGGLTDDLVTAKAEAEAIRQSLKSDLELFFDFKRRAEELVKIAGLSESDALEAIQNAAREIQESTEGVLGPAEQTFEQLNQFAVQAARNIQSAFADFFFDPFKDGLKGLVRGFINAIRRMLANLLASKLLSLLGRLPGGAGGFFRALDQGSQGPGAQLGGFRRGRPFIAGERGPELVTPAGAGVSVKPLGAATFNFETNINSSGSLDLITLIPVLEENNRKLKGEFLDELDRGAFA